MLLGAHNSIAGGLWNAVDEARLVRGDTMQIFCKNQRQWNAPPLDPTDATRFRDAVASAGLERIMVHDSYLINMGNPDDDKRANAADAFRRELDRCEALGVAYLNFHPGSHMDKSKSNRDDGATRAACLDRIASCVTGILDDTRGYRTRLVVENAAGQGTNVGSTWAEVGRLVETIGDDARTGVCVDTQHAWAAGHDWLADYDAVWDRFDDAVGIDRLVALHLNDSKQPCGARVDRHDNIGQGHLGEDFWRDLMQDGRLRGRCGYLETPRPEDSVQVWADEIAYLRSLQDA
jgi:deoxyribonuclease-4